MAFSPNSSMLASSGFLNDGFLRVYNIQAAGGAVAAAKLGSKVFGLAWEDDQTLIAVGNKSIKCWKVSSDPHTPLLGKAVTLASMNNECFVSCSFVPGVGTFALSSSGMLCSLNSGTLSLDRWVNLQSKSYCLEASKKLLFVGTDQGAVHSFDAATLTHVMSFAPPAEPHGPVLAVRLAGDVLHAFFADKTQAKFSVTTRELLETCEMHAGIIMACEAPRAAGLAGLVPNGGFITSAADNSIRIWSAAGKQTRVIKTGAVDGELLRVPTSLASPGMPDFETGRPKGEHGVKSLRLSDDGLHLASGDRDGAVRVFDPSGSCVFSAKAHEGEINALDYSRPQSADDTVLLASAGRDRKLCVFNASSGYATSARSEDHSSSIVAVRFCSDGSKLLSAGQDKSVVIRSVAGAEVTRDSQKSLQHGSLYDMAVDPQHKTFVVGAQDKKINCYGSNGKMVRSRSLTAKNSSSSSDSDMLRICFDPSGLYLAVAGKRQISLFEYATGNAVAVVECGEVTTAMCFSTDLKLVATSADCIYVWRLSSSLTREIASQMATVPAVVPNVLASNKSSTPAAMMVAQQQLEQPHLLDQSYDSAPSWLVKPSEEPQTQQPQLDISSDSMPSWMKSAVSSAATSAAAASPGLFGAAPASPGLFGAASSSSSPLPWLNAKSPVLFGAPGQQDVFGKVIQVIPMMSLDAAIASSPVRKEAPLESAFAATPTKETSEHEKMEIERKQMVERELELAAERRNQELSHSEETPCASVPESAIPNVEAANVVEQVAVVGQVTEIPALLEAEEQVKETQETELANQQAAEKTELAEQVVEQIVVEIPEEATCVSEEPAKDTKVELAEEPAKETIEELAAPVAEAVSAPISLAEPQPLDVQTTVEDVTRTQAVEVAAAKPTEVAAPPQPVQIVASDATKENSVSKQLNEIERTRERLGRLGMLPQRGRALSDAGNTSSNAKPVFVATKYRQALSRLERARAAQAAAEAECKALLEELKHSDEQQPEAMKLREQLNAAVSAPDLPSKMLETYSEKLLQLVAQKINQNM